jgi:Protein of unknown function (DUF2845)
MFACKFLCFSLEKYSGNKQLSWDCDMNRIDWCVFVFCLLSSSPLFALPTRCAGHRIEIGESKDTVYDLCGEPDSAESYYEKRRDVNTHCYELFFNGQQQFPVSSLGNGQTNYTEMEVLVDLWEYSFKNGRTRKSLHFENGRLKFIISLKKHRF